MHPTTPERTSVQTLIDLHDSIIRHDSSYQYSCRCLAGLSIFMLILVSTAAVLIIQSNIRHDGNDTTSHQPATDDISQHPTALVGATNIQWAQNQDVNHD